MTDKEILEGEGRMMELADIIGLKPIEETRPGSNPGVTTINSFRIQDINR